MKKNHLWRIGTAVITFFLLLFSLGCQGGQQKDAQNSQTPKADGARSEAQTVKVGTNKSLGTVTPYLGRVRGAYDQQGMQVELVEFNDGSSMMEAFAVGQLDLAYVGIAPVAIWANKGVPLKVVASANGGGHIVMTREDTGIQKIADLKGKKVAAPKAGSVTDTLFRAKILKEAGLNPETDLSLIPMAPADMAGSLMVAREVDAIVTLEPYSTQTADKFPGSKILYNASAEWKKEKQTKTFYPVNMVVASQKFMERRPEDLKKFLQIHRDLTEFINRDPHANEVIGKEINLTPEQVAKAREQIDYTVEIDAPSSLATLEWSKQLGYLNAIPSEASLFDYTFLPK